MDRIKYAGQLVYSAGAAVAMIAISSVAVPFYITRSLWVKQRARATAELPSQQRPRVADSAFGSPSVWLEGPTTRY